MGLWLLTVEKSPWKQIHVDRGTCEMHTLYFHFNCPSATLPLRPLRQAPHRNGQKRFQVHLVRSWRERLSDERLDAEQCLGYSPERLRKRWSGRGLEVQDGLG